MRAIFILNKVWAQDKIYILVGTLLGWNILPVTYSTSTGSELQAAHFVAG
jgi:hypothetical protein